MIPRALIVPQACLDTKKDWLRAPFARPVQINHCPGKYRAPIVPPVLIRPQKRVLILVPIVPKVPTTKTEER